MNLGYYSYLAAACAYGFFTALLLISWRGSQLGKFLSATIVIGAVWAVSAAFAALDKLDYITWYRLFEVLRHGFWFMFLIKLFEKVVTPSRKNRIIIYTLYAVSVLLVISILANEYLLDLPGYTFRYTGHVFLGLFGLVLVEQLFRNSNPKNRWSLKYLFLGTGALFAYDFYMYADALLFRGVDQSLWEARGIVHLSVMPLLLVATSRNENWTVKVFVSRDIVFNTTAILGGGIYLLAMSAAGYYLREFGGDWGRIGQLAFVCLAIVGLAAVIFSSSLRAKVRVFLGKNFFRNKYDYRIEWLRLTEDLGNIRQHQNCYPKVIETLANTVDARAGMLWMADEASVYRNTASWKLRQLDESLGADDPLVRYLSSSAYVINLFELRANSSEYSGLELPGWVDTLDQPWLIVPLFNQEQLIGFILLSSPLIDRTINWEDRDLLKTAARQVANFLTAKLSSEALAEAKQFEVFTRLSAYMVHDLKNIASELEMVAQNAKRHKDNPEFIADAFGTVRNASIDIRRLLDQLRNRQSMVRKSTLVDLGELIDDAVSSRQNREPKPVTDAAAGCCFAVVEKDRLLNVLGHLIENAQQATADDGYVRVHIENEGASHVISIEDNGHGMDEGFIKDRLFKPFDTTKGNAGMGIGMYESREFVRQSGGDIKVRSHPRQGTMISLTIPAAADEIALTVNQ